MIKIVGLCGSRIKNGNMEALLQEAINHAVNQTDVEAELITLADKQIKGCIHCNWCVSKQSEGKFCSQKDDMRQIYPKILEADGIIVASPAHYGRLSGITADMIDRLRVFAHGNMYKSKLKNKIGGAIAIAFYRGGGIETTLASLNMLFHSAQMIIATSGSYQLGAGAVSSRDGKGKFEKEIRHIVLEDEIGVTSVKHLVDRMVELARIFKAGQNALEDNK